MLDAAPRTADSLNSRYGHNHNLRPAFREAAGGLTQPNGREIVKRFDARLGLGATFCLLAAVLFLVGWQGVHHCGNWIGRCRCHLRPFVREKLVREAFHLSDLNSRLMLSIFLLTIRTKSNVCSSSVPANSGRIFELIRAIEPRLNTAEEKRLFAGIRGGRKPYIESYNRLWRSLWTITSATKRRKSWWESLCHDRRIS